jgi:hypothetical protein
MQMGFSTVAGVATQGNDVTHTDYLLHQNHRTILGEVKVKRSGAIVMRYANDIFLAWNTRIIHEMINNASDRAAA